MGPRLRYLLAPGTRTTYFVNRSDRAPDRTYFLFGILSAGQLRSGYAPVLTITSDQASMMFAAANFLAYSCRLRMVWFPDINHIESNAEKAVFVAAGLQQINEKVSFLARLPYGPRKDAGHWHSQMRQAFEASAITQQLRIIVIIIPASLFSRVIISIQGYPTSPSKPEGIAS